MEKYDFIKLMLQNRNLSVNDKKRLILLATREIEQRGNTPLDVKLVEKKDDNRYNIKYIPPKNLQEFLYRFNQDSILKYTCHEIDTDDIIREICNLCKTEEYSLRKHSELISQAFEELNKKLIADKIYKDSKMYAMLSVYLTGTTKNGQTEWSSLNIQTNWACKELLEWGDNNPGIVPSPGRNIARKQRNNGYELPKALKSDLSGNRILAWKELVIYFKSLFHIRRDNSLLDILRHINEAENYSEKNIIIIFAEDKFKSNVELLTNVDKLLQAYKRIIEICKSCHKDNELVLIELSFYEEDGIVYFMIHDKNSIYGKNLDAATKRIGESHSKLIEKQINGLCDLYIEADFDNQDFARIALWNENSNPLGELPNIDVKRLNNCQGVKYILKF